MAAFKSMTSALKRGLDGVMGPLKMPFSQHRAWVHLREVPGSARREQPRREPQSPEVALHDSVRLP